MSDLIRWRVNLPPGVAPHLGPQWTDLTVRAGTSDEDVIDEIWVQDCYHLRGLDLGEKPLIVDLGANIGAFTALACTIWGDATVLAIEPDEANCELLMENTRRFLPRVTWLRKAIGSHDGVSEMWGSHGTGHLGSTHSGSAVFDVALPVVQVKTLASIYDELPEGRRRHAPVALLKCDIEGGEYDALIGADLSRVERIAMEWHGPGTAAHLPNDGGERYGQLMAWLARTHAVQTFGDPAKGGMLYAQRYET